MIVLKKLEDLKKYYNAEGNSYKFQESIQIEFDLKIESNLIVKGDIDACDIKAGDIDACDIDAWNINAWNINARDIKYFAFAVAYDSFKCVSATARRENGIALCLDQPIFYKDKENK